MLYMTYPSGYVPSFPKKTYDDLSPDERKNENKKILLFIDEQKKSLARSEFNSFLFQYYNSRETERFTITTAEIKDYLNISDFFIKQHLVPNIDFVLKFDPLHQHMKQIYLWDKFQLDKWLMQHCEYSAQTFLHRIDEIVFIPKDFVKLSDYETLKNKVFDIKECVIWLKNSILTESFSHRYGMDWTKTERGKYKHYALKPISFWDQKYKLIPANKIKNKAPELLYREMFEKAAIKVVFSGNKTFFLERIVDEKKVFDFFVSTKKPKTLL